MFSELQITDLMFIHLGILLDDDRPIRVELPKSGFLGIFRVEDHDFRPYRIEFSLTDD